MEEWKTYRLGDVINVLDYMRVPLSSKQRESRKGPYPYYGAQGIIDHVDSFLFDGEYLLIAEDGENLKSKKQDIAQIARGRYWVNNHAHIVESNGRCDIRYICYLLNHIDLSGYITGSAQPKLNQANLLAIELPLPSIEVQTKVSDFLSTFDDKIALNNRINHNLEEQAQALYKSWFVDFEPFKDGKFVNSELGMIPEGWVCAPLASILEYRKKAVNPQKFPDTLFTHYSLPAYDNSREPELQRGAEIMSNKFRLDNKMVLFSKLNPRIKRLWPINVVASDSICSTEFIAYKALKEQHHSFVWCYLNSDSFYEKIMAEVNGATGSHQRFHAEDTLDYIIPYNQMAISEFSKHTIPLLETIIKNEKENRILKKERDELLPKLMAGNVSITC